ncbi:MAG: rhodanese-like domain-containing protein [Nanoarchaeota archaeon]
MKLAIYFLIAVALIFLGCTANEQDTIKAYSTFENATYKNMSVDELNQQLKNKDFVLVDVHIPEQSHINGTDTFIPYDEIENQLDNLPSEKDSKIVLYCRTGRMSEIAAQKLAEKGYSNVYNVVGGMVEWVKRGYDK